MAFINITNSTDTTVSNNLFYGGDIAIRVRNSQITGENNRFVRVSKAWDVVGTDARLSGNSATGVNVDDAAKSGRVRNGPPLPVQCPRCSSIFPSQQYDFGTSRLSSDSNVEECQICHYPYAKLSDGIFELTKEAVEIIHGSDFTKRQLEAINYASLQFVQGITTDRFYLKAIQSVSKPLAKVLIRARRHAGIVLAALGLAVAVASYIQDRNQNNQNPNARVEQLLEQVLEKTGECRFHTKPQEQSEEHNREEQTSSKPPQGEAPPETGSVKVKPQSLPKARDHRRREKAERRRAFSPRHQKPSSCE
ncbi:hypothetical protein HNR00_001027 [Methylorubrum rhodinum]|uniref:Uncharacterized protein n=1 Tax=Methylorubrum rhodinum TaxID=29428 RepID=A0A840ZF28_9HYPH|nr:hypothetical protein [Methylorubrum rhodinum]MBB5756329.1 hypothetical protein [Methylorubrum rhodinum]